MAWPCRCAQAAVGVDRIRGMGRGRRAGGLDMRVGGGGRAGGQVGPGVPRVRTSSPCSRFNSALARATGPAPGEPRSSGPCAIAEHLHHHHQCLLELVEHLLLHLSELVHQRKQHGFGESALLQIRPRAWRSSTNAGAGGADAVCGAGTKGDSASGMAGGSGSASGSARAVRGTGRLSSDTMGRGTGRGTTAVPAAWTNAGSSSPGDSSDVPNDTRSSSPGDSSDVPTMTRGSRIADPQTVTVIQPGAATPRR